MILRWAKPEVEEGDLADAEDEGMGGEYWPQGDGEDGVIDPQLRSDIKGSLEGSDKDL